MSDDRAFQRWGATGFAASVAVAAVVAARLDLALAAQLSLAVAGALTFLAVAWVTRVWTGTESLTYYHHEIAVLAVVATGAAAAGAPVLAHLDASALGLGAFLVFGRIGCLRVGCCHGRTARRGVRYRESHVDAGFPAYLRGAPLVPVQAIESAAVAVIVGAGALAVLDEAAPGQAFVFYVGAYAVVRFALEELRGDATRRYWRGLSEAQWTSLGLVLAECLACAAGILPGGAFALAAALAVGVGAAVVVRRRRRPPAPLDPRHVRELAGIARALARREQPGPIGVWETTAGVRISSGRTGDLRHFTLSRAPAALTREEAARLARVVGEGEVVAGPASTYHLLVAR